MGDSTQNKGPAPVDFGGAIPWARTRAVSVPVELLEAAGLGIGVDIDVDAVRARKEDTAPNVAAPAQNEDTAPHAAAPVAPKAETREDTAPHSAAPYESSGLPVDWQTRANTGAFRLDNLLGSGNADGLVLGDPTNVAASIEVDVHDDDGHTVVRHVHLGADVSQQLTPHAILEKAGVDVDVNTLSPFERFVLSRVDGTRNMRAIQFEMRLSESDIRIALALLLEKGLVRVNASATAGPVDASNDVDGATRVELTLAAGTHEATRVEASEAFEPTLAVVLPPRAPAIALVDADDFGIDVDVDDAAAAAAAAPPLVALETLLLPAPAAVADAPAARSTESAAFAPAFVPAFGAPPPPAFAPPPPPAFASAFAPAPSSAFAAPAWPAPPPPKPPVASTSSTSTATPVPKPPRASTSSQELRAIFSPRTSKGLVVGNAAAKAGGLYDDAVREVKNGNLDKARALIVEGRGVAGDDPRFDAALRDWPAFVAAHKTAEDARLLAQSVRAEGVGDIARALQLAQTATRVNPDNASAWNRVGLLLARQKDLPGAAAALGKALELAPDDAAIGSNFTKIAQLVESSGTLDRGLKSLWKKVTRG